MTWDLLIPVATFLGIALTVWAVLTALAESRSRRADRLERLLAEPGSRASGPTSLERKQDKLQLLLAKAAPTLAKPLNPNNEAELGKIRTLLMNAGFRGENAVQYYLGIKVASMLLAIAIAVPVAYVKYGFNKNGLMAILGAGGLGFYLPGLVVGQIKKMRMESIFLGLPDALDLMVVCVEAGLGLDAAMRRVAHELLGSAPALCEELAISNFQVQMGRHRREVLHDLGVRTGVPDVRALAAILIQAERFGSSIATALRVQSESMRVRRRQLAEERAAKTAVQLIFPLVLFIFPGIFVVLVGPAAIQISETIMKQ